MQKKQSVADGSVGEVDFGFSRVLPREKSALVDGVFSDVAGYYDKMNDVMSLGLHRLWKRQTCYLMGVKQGMRVLDVAAGSGDMSALVGRYLGKNGQLIMADINRPMLQQGVRALPNTVAVQCDGEHLPFASRYFDRLIIAFGLRNMTNPQNTLKEAHRVLKWGGQLFVLEFSPECHLPTFFNWYLTTVLPLMGKAVAKDEKSYRYLGESILRFIPPKQLGGYFQDSGFVGVSQYPMAAGGVMLTYGTKRA